MMNTQEPDYSDDAAKKEAENYLKQKGIVFAPENTPAAPVPAPITAAPVASDIEDAKKSETTPSNPLLGFPKPSQDQSLSPVGAGAVGAGTAMGLRGAGVNLSVKPNIFKPSANPQADAINLKIRQATGIPDFDINKVSSLQNSDLSENIRRMLMGKTDETGNTGRQNMATYNQETSREARNVKANENFVNKNFPGTPDPITATGQSWVRTSSNFDIPKNTADEIEKTRLAKIEMERQTRENQINQQVEDILAGHRKQQRRSMVTGAMGKLGSSGLAGGLMGMELQHEANQPGGLMQEYGHPLTNPLPHLNQLGNLMIYGGGPKSLTQMGIGAALKLPYYFTHGASELENLKKAYPETTKAIQNFSIFPQGGLPTNDEFDYGAAAP
jgi:hypothetical protein